jgi:cysteine-S-conjugate beta-lyase
MNPATQIVHPNAAEWDPFKALSVPIYQTVSFAQESAVASGPYDYTRSGNPTRAALESHVASLEGATRAFAFASGMAAITAVTRIEAAGRRVIAGDDLYGGSYRLLSRVLGPCGVAVEYVPTSDLCAVERLLRAGPALVLVETPSNPRLCITDLTALAGVVHAHGGLLAVDNSLLSPYLQRPLAHGADIVVHSATKALSGHGDVTAGIVAVLDAKLGEQVAFVQNAEGAALSPFESWLLLRGVRTLALRQDRQEVSARRVADFLAAHPRVRQVYYPGLPAHPGHEIHRRQARGAGCVVSFETGCAERSKQLVERTRLFTISVSFGTISSLISLPWAMSHASIPVDARRARGLGEDLVRLSVGIEDADDLIADLAQALEAA